MSRHEAGRNDWDFVIGGPDVPKIVCECGQRFTAEVKDGEWESPDWIAHVREHRHLRYVETLKQVQDLVMKVNLDNPDAVALAMGRLMKLVQP